MGVWDVGAFDNDDALEWLGDLLDHDDPSMISDVLNTVVRLGDSDELLEDDLCNEALAAIELVSALKGSPSPELPEQLRDWVSYQSPPSPALVALALRALQLIRTNSELQQAWEETEYADDWHAMLNDLEARLRS